MVSPGEIPILDRNSLGKSTRRSHDEDAILQNGAISRSRCWQIRIGRNTRSFTTKGCSPESHPPELEGNRPLHDDDDYHELCIPVIVFALILVNLYMVIDAKIAAKSWSCGRCHSNMVSMCIGSGISIPSLRNARRKSSQLASYLEGGTNSIFAWYSYVHSRNLTGVSFQCAYKCRR